MSTWSTSAWLSSRRQSRSKAQCATRNRIRPCSCRRSRVDDCRRAKAPQSTSGGGTFPAGCSARRHRVCRGTGRYKPAAAAFAHARVGAGPRQDIPPPDPVPRSAPQPCNANAGRRHPPEDRPGAPWPFYDRHHPRPLFARHARNAGRRCGTG